MINLAKGGSLDSDKSKKQIFRRVPFVEMRCLLYESVIQFLINHFQSAQIRFYIRPNRLKKLVTAAWPFLGFFSDPIGYIQRMESPRVMKTHLPVSHLHPDVVKTSKVIVVMRNPKDCAASMYHHERLLPNHNLKHDFPFDQYAKIFAGQAGTTSIYGDYWAWVKVLIISLTQFQHV